MRGVPLLLGALVAVGGCSKQPEPVSVENSVEALSANLEQMANELDAAAAGQVNATERATLSEAAATLDNGSDAVDVSDTVANF